MELKYKNDYLSITQFDTYTLPKFTLITGVNGSGKTQLLKAIEQRHVQIDIVDYSATEMISYFDWQTLAPKPSKDVNVSALPDMNDIIRKMNTIKEELKRKIKNICVKFSMPSEVENKITSSFTLLSHTDKYSPPFTSEINAEIKHSAHQIREITKVIVSTENLDDNTLINLEEAEIKNLPVKLGDMSTLFEGNLSLNFLNYHNANLNNKLNKLTFEEGDANHQYLSPEDFITKNGRPPWDIINEIFKNANLDFKITYPEGNFVKSFSIQLKKNSTDKEINFLSLSSGEKILVSIAFCIFHSNEKRINCKKPQLILFDEIDATLHPQMSRQLINSILDVIVEAEGINVIMTTHSPSTVAVAPECSIFLKEPNISKLEKISKTEAINILTDGVPTLAIDFSGRRQVFVENDRDAERYEMIYQMHKQNLASELSLSFIGTGLKSKKNQVIGSGCSIVTKIVTSLQESGNTKVFGLIDWDIQPENFIHKNIKTLGRDYWHSIENCLCDPLLITLFLLRIAPNYLSSELNLNSEITYTSLMTMSEPDMQNATNIIQSKVIGCGIESLEYDSVEFEYHGGFKLKVSKRYCQERGHDLLNKIITTFHPLNKNYKSDQEKLLKNIINQPLKEHLKATPIPLINAYKSLLQ